MDGMRRTGRRGHGDGAQVRHARVAAVQSAGCSGVVWRFGNLGVVRATRGKRSPGLRSQGGRDLGPVPGVLPRHATAARRPDLVGRRQAVHPGPRPLPPHRPGGARQTRAGRARIRPPRRAGPAGRPGRAHWEGVRRHPGHHRHRPVHGPDRPGHEPAGVQGGAPGMRHRGQRLRSPRPGRRRPAPRRLPERDHDPHPGARIVG